MVEPTTAAPAEQQAAEIQAKSSADDASVDLSGSIHEDAPEEPKYVPIEGKKGVNAMILTRKTTLTQAQIRCAPEQSEQSAREHNALLDCVLCKNVMLEPRECSKCRKGFCKKCIDNYINQLIEGDYLVCCPNCSSPNFKLVDPHPLLARQLTKIQAGCENAEQGCTKVISYSNLAAHQAECDYAMIKCLNYGCEAEMFQKDYARHAETCEFRVIRCDKCEVIKVNDEEHDCITSMAAKCNVLEERIIKTAQKLDHELEKAERKRLDEEKGTQLVRFDIALPSLSQIKFNPQYGWNQSLSEDVAGLPANTRAIIVRFGLTDLNIRREYGSLHVYQAGSPTKVDLTNFFFVGPQPLPPFGQCTEIIMPWDQKLDAKLVVEFQVAAQQPPMHPPMHNPYGYPHGPGPYGGHMPPPPMHHQPGSNPYAFAMVSIAGFQFKQ